MELPNDIDSERAVIGACLIDPSQIDAIEHRLQPTDFYDSQLGKILALLVDMRSAGQPITDIAHVRKELISARIVDAGEATVLLGRLGTTTAAVNLTGYYAERVAHTSRLRTILKVALEAADEAKNPQNDPREIAERLDSRIIGVLARHSDTPKHIYECVELVLERMREAQQRNGRLGTPTGLESIDSALGGLFAGELYVLAARPGIGKTALGLQIAEHIAERHGQTLVVSLEMTGAELAARCLCARSGVSGYDVRAGAVDDRQRESVYSSAKDFKQLGLYVYDPPRCTMRQIRAVARMQSRKSPLKLVVVDYIGLVRPDHDERHRPRHEQVAAVSAGLKSLAKELDCPVLALCQVNREAAKEQRLRLHHLRESGAIEQDADQVWFIQRGDRSGDVYLDIAKNRHGEQGEIDLIWRGERTRFEDKTAADLPNYESAFDEWDTQLQWQG